MTDHDSFLTALLQAFPGEVFLVGRYEDAKLGFSDADPLRVFLPDFHWMSAACFRRYTGGYQFNGNLPPKAPRFNRLLGILETADGLEVYQLGDRYDLWRELTKDEDILAAYQRLRSDPDVSGLADRLNALNTKFIRGNHDAWLSQVEPHNDEPLSFKDLEAAGGNIFLTHGHRYDSIERLLPDEVKAFFVELCPKVKPQTHPIGVFGPRTIKKLQQFLTIRQRAGYPEGLYPTVRPDGAQPVTALADIEVIGTKFTTYLDLHPFLHGTDNQNDFEHCLYLSFGDKIFTSEVNHPRTHHLHVIGHTHHARLLVDTLPTGEPLAIMDCGGWIENCTVFSAKLGATHSAPSGQVGVQHGNDIRIYQIGASLDA